MPSEVRSTGAGGLVGAGASSGRRLGAEYEEMVDCAVRLFGAKENGAAAPGVSCGVGIEVRDSSWAAYT